MSVAVHEGSLLAVQQDQTFWNPQQIAALKQLGLQDATNEDLAVFFHHSQRTGLDPFARQIYMVGRWSREGTKYTIQTGIDGFRLIGRRAADARHETLEVSDTEWCGSDGQWTNVWLSHEPPAAARVSIIRNGGRFPAVALFHEYAQTKKDGSLTQMWDSKGALMIAKCAEALAWRKAFPQDLSGLYTTEEMQQADNNRVTVTQVQEPAPAQVTSLQDAVAAHRQQSDGITADQKHELGKLIKDLDLGRDEYLTFVAGQIGRQVAGTTELSQSEAATVIAALSADPAPDETVDETTGEVLDAEVVA